MKHLKLYEDFDSVDSQIIVTSPNGEELSLNSDEFDMLLDMGYLHEDDSEEYIFNEDTYDTILQILGRVPEMDEYDINDIQSD